MISGHAAGIRIGIIGTGRIAARFVPEARYVERVVIVGCYNPHSESAEQFSRRFQLDFCTDDRDWFYRQVDAVYIASPHETHYEYAKQALSRGKHVLCEKPMAFSKKEIFELFTLSHKHSCVLLEAIKTAYCPGFAKLLETAKSGIIGEIVDVEACFSRLTPSTLRERRDTEYGGSFTEFGNHTMLPIWKLMGTEYEDVRFDSILAANGVDLYTKAYFRYKNGMALSKSGVGVKSEGQLLISGTGGYILAESPWWMTKTFEVRFEDSTRREQYCVEFMGDGLRYEINDFVSMISGQLERSARLTEDESIAMAGVVEKFMDKRRRERRLQKTDGG